MCLAASADDAFLSLKGAPNQSIRGFESLQNIPRYNDFLRLVVFQWLLNQQIDISMLRCEEVGNVGDNLEQVGASAPVAAASQASVKSNACNNYPDQIEKAECLHENVDNCTPRQHSATNVSNIPLGSAGITLSRFIERCTLSGGRKCTINYEHYQCALCPPCKHFLSLYRINRHIQQTHVNPENTFDYDGYRILPCKQEHYSHPYSACRYHYHCPVCNKTVFRKSGFVKHMDVHTLRVKAGKPFPKASSNAKRTSNEELSKLEAKYETTKDQAVKEPEPEAKTSHCTEELADFRQANNNLHLNSEPAIRGALNPHVLCHLCGKSMLKKNLKRHSVTVHKRVITTAVCCDQKRGLYMVRKTQNGGIGYPVHMQKIIHGSTSTSIDCGDLKCKIEMQVASRAKMPGRECKHLRQVNNASYPDRVILLEARIISKF